MTGRRSFAQHALLRGLPLLALAFFACSDGPLRRIGATCVRDHECQSGRCDELVCKPQAPATSGAPCEQDLDCESEQCDVVDGEGTCAEHGERTEGVACSVDAQCASARCVAGRCAAKQIDGGPPVDSAQPDAGSDGPLADLARDGASADLVLPLDSSVDLPDPSTACSAPATVGASALGSPSFVFCVSASGGISQCEAANLCAPDWQLCPASAYQRRFANQAPPYTPSAWLAGCIREGGAPFAPIDRTCACSSGSGGYVDISWYCGTNEAAHTINITYLGLHSYNQCRKVGENVATAGAYWRAERSYETGEASAAVCCR